VKYVLDTHYVLWTLFEPERIDPSILAILNDETLVKCVSGISLWEIPLKYSLGKLELIGTNPSEIVEKIEESGFEIIPIENHVFASYYQLPKKKNHKDPFDRLLVWQTIQTGMVLLTKDRRMEEYVEDGLKMEMGR